MEALKEVQRLVPQLTAREKAELVEWMVTSGIEEIPGIERTEGVCGGAACVVRTRIPVWLLESYRRAGTSEAELLTMYPTLRAEDLQHAWWYADSHRQEIERWIETWRTA